MNWTKQINEGDTVSYSDVSLWSRTGTLVRFAKGKQGGDCVVQWDRDNQISEECSTNLIAWKDD